jgi:hypothetical protein
MPSLFGLPWVSICNMGQVRYLIKFCDISKSGCWFFSLNEVSLTGFILRCILNQADLLKKFSQSLQLFNNDLDKFLILASMQHSLSYSR